MDEALSGKLVLLADTFGPLHTMMDTLRSLTDTPQTIAAYAELENLNRAMDAYGLSDNVYLDFSIVNDLNYYNGIVFQGYVDGLPTHLLSGGRYDKLMEKLGKAAGGIGFGVYVSLLERFRDTSTSETETTLSYDGSNLIDTIQNVESLVRSGKRVRAVREVETP